MPLLDIEKIIMNEKLKSRFRLVHVAGLRARELNNARESSTEQTIDRHSKVTTNALEEIIEHKIDFDKIDE